MYVCALVVYPTLDDLDDGSSSQDKEVGPSRKHKGSDKEDDSLWKPEGEFSTYV